MLATRVAILGGFVGGLELLCRTGVIDPLTVIPPSEMRNRCWR